MNEFVTYPNVSMWASKEDALAMVRDIYNRGLAAGLEAAASACAARAERHAQAAEQLLPGTAAREFVMLRGEAAACERDIRVLAAADGQSIEDGGKDERRKEA